MQRCPGKTKFVNVRLESFEEFLFPVTDLINLDTDMCGNLCSKMTPFLTCSHDGWDGRTKDLLGVTLFWCSLILQEFVVAPVGMVMARGKKAEQITDRTLEVLQRVEVFKSLVCKAVNDTCNTALAAGRGITAKEEMAPA